MRQRIAFQFLYCKCLQHRPRIVLCRWWSRFPQCMPGIDSQKSCPWRSRMCRLRRRCMLRNLILWCSSRQSTANRHWRLSSLIQSCRCLRHTENSLSDCQKLCCMYLPGIKCSWLRLGCLLLSYKLLLGTEHKSLRTNCPPWSYRLRQSTAGRWKGHWQKRMCQ